MQRDSVNDLLLGASSAVPGAQPNYLRAISEAATRIAAALEAGATETSAAQRIVAALEANAKALESIAQNVAALREQSRQQPREPGAGASQDRLQRS